jgi:hypothetical protein
MGITQMTEWTQLSEPQQLHLATEALHQASIRLATYADSLAAEMEAGAIPDWGGQDALRLFANLVRAVHTSDRAGVGNA